MPPVLIVVMGVSGTGKSTLGSALARALHMPYVEGDELHPKSNVDKMSSGIPLTDADREPWLELIRTTAEHMTAELTESAEIQGVVVTCSALKKYYRDILRGKRKPASVDTSSLPAHLSASDPHVLPTYFVFIDGPRDVLLDRMEKRPGHFMKAGMLDSQLATLERPIGEEGVVVVSLQDETDHQVNSARRDLQEIFNTTT